jgi:hypothetical protein
MAYTVCHFFYVMSRDIYQFLHIDKIFDNHQFLASWADALQIQFERIARVCGAEQLYAVVATEGDEVQAALVLVADRLDVHSPGL